MRRLVAAFFLLALLFLPAAICGQTTTLSPEANEASARVASAEKDMADMAFRNLPLTRYNDTFSLVKQNLASQLALEAAGKKADYSFVAQKLLELGEIKRSAYTSMDELKALEMALEKTEGINKTAVLGILNQAKAEFKAERYEKAVELVEKGYAKISEEEAFQTKISVFYEAASRGIMTFLRERWMEILAISAAVVLVVLLTHKRIECAMLRRRIRALEERKESIRKLIIQTQKDYFDRNKTGEETYHIRTKKYAEMVRDINRQIPLLKEELALKRDILPRINAGASSPYRAGSVPE